MNTLILPQLESLMRPYFGREPVDPDARLVEDLSITGHDYFDLISDIERTFRVDLHDFLIGPTPQYVSTGCIGWLMREPKKPVLRDVSIGEINEFLLSR